VRIQNVITFSASLGTGFVFSTDNNISLDKSNVSWAAQLTDKTRWLGVKLRARNENFHDKQSFENIDRLKNMNRMRISNNNFSITHHPLN
jgi:hypothetical protein